MVLDGETQEVCFKTYRNESMTEHFKLLSVLHAVC